MITINVCRENVRHAFTGIKTKKQLVTLTNECKLPTENFGINYHVTLLL